MDTIEPKTEADVEKALSWALENKTPLCIRGHGTKSRLAPSSTTTHILDLSNLNGILSYEPDELVISALAGTPLDVIKEALNEKGQHLAFEPLEPLPVIGESQGSTLGGMVAAGLSGPRRLSAGGVRDHILGLSGVTGRALAFKIGGRVVKNVSGYDLSKLLTGSWGTLAAMTRITMKVLPSPPETRTLHLSGETREETLHQLRKAAASPCQITGAALLEDGDGVIRLEGRDDEIDQRLDLLKTFLDTPGKALMTDESQAIWQSLSSLTALSEEEIVWRIEIPRASAAVVLDVAPNKKAQVDWAGARIWLGGDLSEDERAAIRNCGARLALFHGGEDDWRKESMQAAANPALGALKSRIRDAFDPLRILNPHIIGRG